MVSKGNVQFQTKRHIESPYLNETESLAKKCEAEKHANTSF